MLILYYLMKITICEIKHQEKTETVINELLFKV